MTSELAAGWRSRSLDELLEISSGEVPPRAATDASVPVFGANGPIGFAPTANFGPGYLIGRVGTAGAVTRVCGRVWASDNALTAAVRPAVCDSSFAGHLLDFLNLPSLATKNAQPLVTQSNVGAIRIAVPAELAEQAEIGRILDSLDNTILEAEAAFRKLSLLSDGLARQLLTSGVASNGRPRDVKTSPREFKETLLGPLPTSWDVGSLGDVVDPDRPIVYGILMPGYGYEGPGGVPVVKVKDIVGGNVRTTELLITSPSIDNEYRRSRLAPGDLLFTIRGTVGRTAFVPPQLDGANITQDTARVAVKSANPVFVREALAMPWARAFVELHTIGQAVKGINLGDLRRLPLPLPRRDEQDRIASILSLRDQRVGLEHSRLTKLRQIKKGFASDLLSARVRVSRERPTELIEAMA